MDAQTRKRERNRVTWRASVGITVRTGFPRCARPGRGGQTGYKTAQTTRHARNGRKQVPTVQGYFRIRLLRLVGRWSTGECFCYGRSHHVCRRGCGADGTSQGTVSLGLETCTPQSRAGRRSSELLHFLSSQMMHSEPQMASGNADSRVGRSDWQWRGQLDSRGDRSGRDSPMMNLCQPLLLRHGFGWARQPQRGGSAETQQPLSRPYSRRTTTMSSAARSCDPQRWRCAPGGGVLRGVATLARVGRPPAADRCREGISPRTRRA